MKKVFSSLLFSTATLGGVVGLTAQANQVTGTKPASSKPSVQATEMTKAILKSSEIVTEKENANPETVFSASILTLAHKSNPSVAPVSEEVIETEEVAYEDIQAVRTGYSTVTVEVLDVKVEAPKAAEANDSVPALESNPELTVSPASAGAYVEHAAPAPVEVAPTEPVEVVEPVEAAPAPVEVTSVTTPAETVEAVAPVEATPAPAEVAPVTTTTDVTVAPAETTPAVTTSSTSAEAVPAITTETPAPVAAEVTTVQSVEVAPAPAPAVQTSAEVAPVVALRSATVTSPSSETTNTYPIGQCTWGAKTLAPWVGNNWGNAGQWVSSARTAGFTVGTTPAVGAVAVWPNDGGGYGHVAVVTSVESSTRIQVSESNYAGNQSIANYRGWFNPTHSIWGGGTVYYIYPNA